MKQLNFITNILGMNDKNIIILDYLDAGTHKEEIPYLECAGYKTLILLKKRRFHCKNCGKIAVAETSLVKKNHQFATIVKQ